MYALAGVVGEQSVPSFGARVFAVNDGTPTRQRRGSNGRKSGSGAILCTPEPDGNSGWRSSR
jgi:hypothetical protein